MWYILIAIVVFFMAVGLAYYNESGHEHGSEY
jgi:hypothetical protein